MLVLLSGPIGAGKTTLCQTLATAARANGFVVGGVLAPAIVENGRKVGVRSIDLGSGETRVLARLDRDLGGIRIGRYSFDDRALAWAELICLDALASGAWVFVDEIGKLELEQDRGLARVIPSLGRPRVSNTIVVVRDTLVDRLAVCVAIAAPRIIYVNPAHRDAAQAEIEHVLFAHEPGRAD